MNKAKTSLLTILLAIAILLSSCSILFPPPYVDISDHPRMQHLVGHCLELKVNAFLYQYPDTKTYAMDIPGSASDLPTTVNEYLRDPLNWGNTDSNAKRGLGEANGYLKHKIIAVIPKGTRMYVAKVLEKQTLYESFVEVIAYLDNPNYADLPVDIYFLLKKEYGKVVIPYPDEPERTIMGSEINVYPDAILLDYCDEPCESVSDEETQTTQTTQTT